MAENELAAAIFADARVLYADALEMLELGKLRNAAEKAWGATKRATDALVLARTGREPQSTGQSTRAIKNLRGEGVAFVNLERRYRERIRDLHGRCFYYGNCEPGGRLVAKIREKADYVRDAERLAVA